MYLPRFGAGFAFCLASFSSSVLGNATVGAGGCAAVRAAGAVVSAAGVDLAVGGTTSPNAR